MCVCSALEVMQCIGAVQYIEGISSIHWKYSSAHQGDMINALGYIISALADIIICVGISSVHWGILSVHWHRRKSSNEVLLGVDLKNSTSDRTGRLVLCLRVRLPSFHR